MRKTMIDMTEPKETFEKSGYSYRGISDVTGVHWATCKKVLGGEGTTLDNTVKVLDALGFELVVRRKGE